ncbi:hypothetical protein [Streptomyces lancefieldiae]|uniref:Uncharacterized protein n=1 Tax=Streptomyces lancefieldiae TaxID=3075520 RepID=A0ABU3AYV5_9ACTN|nr:hypothetical protein [Streptomyces sp. DSM 40712]MDT0615093.1 hypothetical protein [Streptomyces sp. DSM 40712]
MSATPNDLRRVGRSAPLGIGAAFTTAAFGAKAIMREEALSTACRSVRDSRAKDAEAAVQVLRDAARALERGRR